MPRPKQGFTLIELLIVVVIIGILAAIAIPKFANTKEKAYVASMKTDLRNLITAQDAYYADNNSYYAAGTANLGTNYRASTGISVVIGGATASGWQATATSTLTAMTCRIDMNAGSTQEGLVLCQ
jgi:type IV pilus assembly protein PilA